MLYTQGSIASGARPHHHGTDAAGTSNRVLQITDPDDNVTAYEYDLPSDAAHQALREGASGRRTRMTLTADGVQVMDQAYNYSDGRRVAGSLETAAVPAIARGRRRVPAGTRSRLVLVESGTGVPPVNRLRLTFVYDHQRRRSKKVYTFIVAPSEPVALFEKRLDSREFVAVSNDLRLENTCFSGHSSILRQALQAVQVPENCDCCGWKHTWKVDLNLPMTKSKYKCTVTVTLRTKAKETICLSLSP